MPDRSLPDWAANSQMESSFLPAGPLLIQVSL
jgi:hypothetical protein